VHLETVIVHDVQNIRALPGEAGFAFAWNHQILHWGGRSSSRARGPRVSISFEFRRRSTNGKRTIPRGRLPTFDERLKLVAEQIIQFRHMSGVEPPFVELATRLLR
jgi:hypothetical protein